MSKILIAGVIVTVIVWWQVGFTEALYAGGAVGGLFVASRFFGKTTPEESSVSGTVADRQPRSEPDAIAIQTHNKKIEEATRIQEVAKHAEKLDKIHENIVKAEARKRTERQRKKQEELEDLRIESQISQLRQATQSGPGTGFFPRGGPSLFGQTPAFGQSVA